MLELCVGSMKCYPSAQKWARFEQFCCWWSVIPYRSMKFLVDEVSIEEMSGLSGVYFMRCLANEVSSQWIVWLMKYLVDEVSSWSSVQLMKCLVDEVSSWSSVQLVEFPVDQVSSWSSVQLMKYPVGELSSWWSVWLMRCLADEAQPHPSQAPTHQIT